MGYGGAERITMNMGPQHPSSHGVFQTEAGQLNEAVHLWAYKDLNDRAAVRGKVLQDPEWQVFLGKSAPCLAEMKAIVLNPAPHSPMK